MLDSVEIPDNLVERYFQIGEIFTQWEFIYNPQNETCNERRTKGAKIKTKREDKTKRNVQKSGCIPFGKFRLFDQFRNMKKTAKTNR